MRELLDLQQPLSAGPEHDEMLFIVIHQAYELWFKQLIHEMREAQRALAADDLHKVLALMGRIRTIMKHLVSQIDILETMTPLQFGTFRDRLEAASGFQSAQFRAIEALLGRRGTQMFSHFAPDSPERKMIEDLQSVPSLWDSLLQFLANRGYAVPKEILQRDVRETYEPSPEVEAALLLAYQDAGDMSVLLERFIDVDEGVQEWRYRHVKMVERTIGAKVGTGGSSGAAYLAKTLMQPSFPELWSVRSRF